VTGEGDRKADQPKGGLAGEGRGLGEVFFGNRYEAVEDVDHKGREQGRRRRHQVQEARSEKKS